MCLVWAIWINLTGAGSFLIEAKDRRRINTAVIPWYKWSNYVAGLAYLANVKLQSLLPYKYRTNMSVGMLSALAHVAPDPEVSGFPGAGGTTFRSGTHPSDTLLTTLQRSPCLCATRTARFNVLARRYIMRDITTCTYVGTLGSTGSCSRCRHRKALLFFLFSSNFFFNYFVVMVLDNNTYIGRGKLE